MNVRNAVSPDDILVEVWRCLGCLFEHIVLYSERRLRVRGCLRKMCVRREMYWCQFSSIRVMCRIYRGKEVMTHTKTQERVAEAR